MGKRQIIALGSLAAVLIRLMLSFALGDKVSLFAQPELAAFLIKSETGRVPESTTAPVSPDTTAPEQTQPEPTEPEAPAWSPEPPDSRPSFTAEDLEYMGVTYNCVYKPDLEALLTQKLSWDLTGESPTILIIHTHGTEAYTPAAGSEYTEYGGEYRTTDDSLNMISIGDELTALLEQAGLKVIHDRTAYDKNDYEDAYENARMAVQDWLAQYPSIQLVLDLHRDAAEYSDGSQWATSATVNGRDAAQLMVVVGSAATGTYHPDWEENLALGEKLTVTLNKLFPGVARDLNFRAKRFNQDLSTGSLIVEVGAAGNTHQEALNALPALAQAILDLAQGTQ